MNYDLHSLQDDKLHLTFDQRTSPTFAQLRNIEDATGEDANDPQREKRREEDQPSL